MAKLLLTASINAMQNVSGLTPRVVAVLMAIGQNNAAAAVLLMNSVMNVAATHMATSVMYGELPQMLRRLLAIIWATPVVSSAFPRQILPAKTARISQLMEFIACELVQQRKIIMAAAASKQLESKGMMLNAESKTIAIMMAADMAVFFPNFLPTVALSIMPSRCSFFK